MSEHPNVAAARAGLEAFLKGDREAFAAALSDETVSRAGLQPVLG